MPVEILSLSTAAQRLGIPTLDLVWMVWRREIPYVLVDGVPRIASDVVGERQSLRAS